MKEIPLTQGYAALVDESDYERLSGQKWFASVIRQVDGRALVNVYARRFIEVNGKVASQSMHRFIMGITDPSISVDHVNHNGLDNRRENLRICTISQNQANSRKRRFTLSRFKGVTLNQRTGKWNAYIRINGKRTHLGTYGCEEDAGAAYADAASKHFGEFANPAERPL